jgi:hypothetical protein
MFLILTSLNKSKCQTFQPKACRATWRHIPNLLECPWNNDSSLRLTTIAIGVWEGYLRDFFAFCPIQISLRRLLPPPPPPPPRTLMTIASSSYCFVRTERNSGTVSKTSLNLVHICLWYHCLQLLMHTFFCELFGWTSNDNSPPTYRRHMRTMLYRCEMTLSLCFSLLFKQAFSLVILKVIWVRLVAARWNTSFFGNSWMGA